MADILLLISHLSFATSIGFGVLAVSLFFVFKIPDVIGELSGRKTKRSIQKLREVNEKDGRKLCPGKMDEKKNQMINQTYMHGQARSNMGQEYFDTDILPKAEVLNTEEKVFGGETELLDKKGAAAIIEEVMIVHTETVV